jgi:hypothetical protein
MIIKVPMPEDSTSCEPSQLIDPIEDWMRSQVSKPDPPVDSDTAWSDPKVFCTVSHCLGNVADDAPRRRAIFWVYRFPEILWESLAAFVLSELHQKGRLDGSVVARGVKVDPDEEPEYDVVWPRDYEGTFSVFGY